MDALHYSFAIELNDENDSIYGRAEIKLIYKSGGPLQFDLVQTGRDGKGMQVLRVEANPGSEPYPFSQQNNKIILPVVKGKPGDTLVFRILYKGIPKDGLIISKNKFGERTFFADHWPNRAHHWLPCVDRPDDKASVEFKVAAPSHYRVIANGLKTSEENRGKNTITTWKEDTPLSTKVMVIGVARFAIKTFPDSPEQLPVSAWVYPKDSTKGFYDYALAPEILKFFSNYIAPFPFSKLANVQSTTIFGGMENASCIFYAESAVTGDRSSEALMAHEIAHQWFGDAVSEKSFNHVWLSEGFATYLTHLYFEQKYGKPEVQKRLRVDRKEIIAFNRANPRPVVDSSANLMSLLNANSYQKGSWMLHMLRQQIGDDAFRESVQTYYQQYKNGNAETSDFQQVTEGVTGKKLTGFFDQWLYRPGVPRLAVKKRQTPEGLQLTIEQVQEKTYDLTIALQIESDSSNPVRQHLKLQDRSLTTTFPVHHKLKIVVDPDTELLYEEVNDN